MPELCRFSGIVIAMFYRDHGPPHFHAYFGDQEAVVDILTGGVTGRLPVRQIRAIQRWRVLHRQELLDNWRLAEARCPLRPIEPLERR